MSNENPAPAVMIAVSEYAGSPEERADFTRRLAHALSPEVRRVAAEQFPNESFRLVVAVYE